MKNGAKSILGGFGKAIGNIVVLIKKTLWILARDAFLFILIVTLLSIILVEFLFYVYVIVPETKDGAVSDNIVQFKKDTYDSIIAEWQKRDSIFSNPSKINYPNPF